AGARGPAVRRSRAGLRAPLDLRAHAHPPAARDERQDDVPRHDEQVLAMRAALLALVLLSATPAAAQVRRWGIVTGARATTGELQDRYRFGYVRGFEASYLPTWIGLAWSMQYTWFWNLDDPRNVETLQLIDLDGAVRVRLPPFPPFPFYVFGNVGGAII